MCCLCCKSGPVSGTIHLDRIGFVPGEEININAEIQNLSSFDCDVWAILEMVKFPIVNVITLLLVFCRQRFAEAAVEWFYFILWNKPIMLDRFFYGAISSRVSGFRKSFLLSFFFSFGTNYWLIDKTLQTFSSLFKTIFCKNENCQKHWTVSKINFF